MSDGHRAHDADGVRAAAHPLERSPADFEPLLARVGDARVVLLGEATHGTHEFYRARAELTRQLVERKGFDLVAVEADWPDAYRVNRFVRGASRDGDAEEALGGFQRFPSWMWRNADVVDFVGWLRAFNEAVPPGRPRVGFYGLDLYSLYNSIAAVIGYLATVDPELASRARSRYACFDHFNRDSQAYGYAARLDLSQRCERAAVDQLLDLRARADELARRDGRIPEDEFFYAEQNARLVVNAEAYYRAMFGDHVASWNLRDRHMTETLRALLDHFARKGQAARAVVWAHNSHVGDARATELGTAGELNIGQLARATFGTDAVLVGFTTYDGTVTAAAAWDEPAGRRRVRPALDGSIEALFHATGIERFLVLTAEPHLDVLARAMLERAIGVVYRPETERLSHYFRAVVQDQFDAIFHYDHTRAVEPLERSEAWQEGEAPETFPVGL